MSEADAVRQGTQFLSIPLHSAATVQALGTSTLGRCDRGQSNTTDFFFYFNIHTKRSFAVKC